MPDTRRELDPRTETVGAHPSTPDVGRQNLGPASLAELLAVHLEAGSAAGCGAAADTLGRLNVTKGLVYSTQGSRCSWSES
eukprot:3702049-Rhodomonas_salina.2